MSEATSACRPAGLMLVGVSTVLGSERNVPPRATVKVKPSGTCATLTPRTVVLVPLGLDEVSIDRLFAQRPACFEAMQSVYEDEAVTIAPRWVLAVPLSAYSVQSFGLPLGLSVARRLIGT